MLTSKSEQERKLLVSLVNKVSSRFLCKIFFSTVLSLIFQCFTQLGDPQNKSASNADFHLTNLLADHPNMKVRLFNLLMPGFGILLFRFFSLA